MALVLAVRGYAWGTLFFPTLGAESMISICFPQPHKICVYIWQNWKRRMVVLLSARTALQKNDMTMTMTSANIFISRGNYSKRTQTPFTSLMVNESLTDFSAIQWLPLVAVYLDTGTMSIFCFWCVCPGIVSSAECSQSVLNVELTKIKTGRVSPAIGVLTNQLDP